MRSLLVSTYALPGTSSSAWKQAACSHQSRSAHLLIVSRNSMRPSAHALRAIPSAAPQALRRLEPRARENLAYQKETLGLALEIAGMSRDDLLAWTPTDASQQSFLDGLPGAQVREDAMLLSDFSTVPGFEAMGETTHYGSKVFASEEDSSKRLTVIMANRLPLEQQTGADLIYFNEAYRSFVMVQYKAMEKREDEVEFRWRVKDQFCDEVQRMETLLAELRKLPSGEHPDGFRFSDNPFFLKFCPRVVFNPDDKGLFKGIYLPLDLWKRADAAGLFKGPRGGKVLTFKNVGRRINNSEFVGLVAGSWVGTSIEQSAVLSEIVPARCWKQGRPSRSPSSTPRLLTRPKWRPLNEQYSEAFNSPTSRSPRSR